MLATGFPFTILTVALGEVIDELNYSYEDGTGYGPGTKEQAAALCMLREYVPRAVARPKY